MRKPGANSGEAGEKILKDSAGQDQETEFGNTEAGDKGTDHEPSADAGVTLKVTYFDEIERLRGR